MKLEIVVLAITGFLIANAYYDGKIYETFSIMEKILSNDRYWISWVVIIFFL